MGLCARGGGWGRVQKEGLCEGEDGEAREAFPLAVEGQRRENGFERIIRAGKRGWERRRGVRGGGFTRPGSYCTRLKCTWTHRSRAATALLPEGACRSPLGLSLPN